MRTFQRSMNCCRKEGIGKSIAKNSFKFQWIACWSCTVLDVNTVVAVYEEKPIIHLLCCIVFGENCRNHAVPRIVPDVSS